MNKIFRSLTVAVFLFAVSLPGAQAQFGGLKKLVGGGEETAEAEPMEWPSPEKLEADLIAVIALNNRIISSVYAALGEKEEADLNEKNAACLEKGECGVSDAIGATQKSSKKLQDIVAKKEKENLKMEPEKAKDFGVALERLGELVERWPPLVKVGKRTVKDPIGAGEALGKDIVKPATKVPGTFTTSLGMARSLISYGTFNGIDTSELQTKVEVATKDL